MLKLEKVLKINIAINMDRSNIPRLVKKFFTLYLKWSNTEADFLVLAQ